MRTLSCILFMSFVLMTVGCSKKEPKEAKVQCNSTTRPLERKYPVKDLPENMKLVTSDYGYARLSEGRTIYDASSKRGWSSWWYPLNKQDFHFGELSPLGAYDKWVRTAEKRASNAASWHQQNRYKPNALSWEGYCSPRAFASVFEYVPDRPVKVDGMCFTPGQLKGIATQTYETVNSDDWGGAYGQRNINRADDYLMDIYPEQLLRFTQLNLHDRGIPFLMDYYANSERWMDSVHRAVIDVERAEQGDAIDVVISFKVPAYELRDDQVAADILGEPDADGDINLNDNAATREYTAKLYGCWNGDQFEAQSGEWTNDSIQDHPDYVIEVPLNRIAEIEPQRGSFNPEVNVNSVDSLLRKAKIAEQKGQFCRP